MSSQHKNKSYIMVSAITCPSCKDTIYSRATHDFRSCSCGKYSIDGGFDYFKCSYDPSLPMPVPETIRVYTTRMALYNDWNKNINKYGLIKKKV